MFYISLAVCFLSLSAVSALPGPTRNLMAFGHEHEYEPAPEPEVPAEPECVPEEGIWRPGSTYNDPAELITSTALECCNLCRDDDRCLTWSRRRATGACALKDANATAFLDDRYDSGFIGTTDALDAVPLPACFVEERISYPDGDVMLETPTASMDACCELCLENQECFSWYRHEGTQTCVLNRNIPPAVARGGNYAGAALV